jgi:hypothetical protein
MTAVRLKFSERGFDFRIGVQAKNVFAADRRIMQNPRSHIG